MRALVCGGRTFNDYEWMNEVLSSLTDIHEEKITTVIHGCASGADTLAGQWARENNIPVVEFPANWSMHGKAAGPIRNKQMLVEGKPDVVVAFPGGVGTANMVRQAKQTKTVVIEL